MLHLVIEDKETGKIKVDKDVMFVSGVFGDDKTATRFCDAHHVGDSDVIRIIHELTEEAAYLSETYLKNQ